MSERAWSAENRLDATFLHALGRFVATVCDFEDLLLTTAWRIRSTEQKPEDEWDQVEVTKVLDRFEKGLSDQLARRLQLFKESYQNRYEDWSDSKYDEFMDQANKVREYRNCFCHCSWQRTDVPGAYRAKWISRDKTILEDLVDPAMLNQISAVIEELVQSLIKLMASKGIHPRQDP